MSLVVVEFDDPLCRATTDRVSFIRATKIKKKVDCNADNMGDGDELIVTAHFEIDINLQSCVDND